MESPAAKPTSARCRHACGPSVECRKTRSTSKLIAVFRGPKIDKSRGCVLCDECGGSRKRSIFGSIQKAMNRDVT
jgi:hypothetical protein